MGFYKNIETETLKYWIEVGNYNMKIGGYKGREKYQQDRLDSIQDVINNRGNE